jgi:prepilin-type N-terminal cleavage/methylation domain-containing protein
VIRFPRLSERGFSLPELMMTMAVAATLMLIAIPAFKDVTEGSKLGTAARELEREFQSARLKAVTSNRILRVRTNCPSAGFVRTVEYLNGAADTAANRCLTTAYPYPPDTDLMTRPNYDGPLRVLPPGATVPTVTLEFLPDGTAQSVVSNVRQAIVTPVTVTVTRNSKTKAMTINAAGKIQLQQ